MSNVRVIAINDVDTATLSVSPAVVATLSVTYLQSPMRGEAMRTTSTAAQDIKGTWTSGKVISGAAMDRHNLTSAGTWRLRLYSDAAWTTLVYDSGHVVATPPKALGELVWGVDPLGATVFSGWALVFSDMYFSPVVAQSFILTLTDADNPAGYMQVSRLHMGYTLVPESNFDWNVTVKWVDKSKLTRTAGGSLRVDPSITYRTMDIKFSWLGSGDRARFLDLFRSVGSRTDVWINLYPGQGGMMERDHAMRAMLVGGGDTTHNRYNNWVQPIQLEEA